MDNQGNLYLSGFVKLLLTIVILGTLSCQLPGKDTTPPYLYDQEAVLIYNPDLGQIPLPNNLLNPIRLAQLGVEVPGFDFQTTAMELPFYDDEATNLAAELGYNVEKDSELTAFLKRRMNLLDGFFTGFTLSIPFNALLDMSTLVAYEADENNDNADVATFFFLDITDPENPVVKNPEEYFLLSNPTQASQAPYQLVLKNKPQSSILPENFSPGYSYLVVLTSTEAQPLKDDQSRRIKADAAFFAHGRKNPLHC